MERPEYQFIDDVQFNRNGDILYLLPFGNTDKIIVYDVEGHQLPDIPLAFRQRMFSAFFSDSIITIISYPFKNDSAICYQQTYSGKPIQKISPPYDLINKDFNGVLVSNQSTGYFDFFNTASDTLFHYDPNKNILEPKITISYNEGERPIFLIYEQPGFYYFWLYKPGEEKGTARHILVDKTNLEAKYFNIVNDSYGGILAYPLFKHKYYTNCFSALTLKIQIQTAINKEGLTDQMRQKLTDLNNSLDLEDNNIVFFGKLKQVQN